MTERNARVRRGEQGGFALTATMFVIVMFAGVTLAVLTSMTLSASEIRLAQSRNAREVRAADNALESAINLLRMDPSGDLGLIDSCIDPDGIELPSNDQSVTVTAQCEESLREMPDRGSGPATATPMVSLVGADGYASPSGFDDTVLWRNDCLRGDRTLNSCFPWALGIGPPNYQSDGVAALTAAQPSLVHSGGLGNGADEEHTLRFAADVAARRGSAAIIDRNGDRPALSVAGTYEQGDAGLFSTGDAPCGIAGPGHNWNVAPARIVDADVDDDGAPTCDSATSAAALDERQELAPRPGIDASFTAFAPTPACDRDANGVVTLPAGAYGKVQTAALNRLLGGECTNSTFWFQTGQYWFDVEDPTNPDGSARPRDEWSSLTISDPTARLIFGQPRGGNNSASAAAATFPVACEPGALGVELVLSPRTTIRHEAGQVAVCDRDVSLATGNAPAAIWQAGAHDGGWQGYPNPTGSTVTMNRSNDWLAWGSSAVDNAANAWRVDGQFARARFTCNIIITGTCASDVVVRGVGMGVLGPDNSPAAPPAAGALRSLDVIVRAAARNDSDFDLSLVAGGQGSTRIDLYLPGATTPTCAVGYPGLPDPRSGSIVNTLAYDLLSTTAEDIPGVPSCRNAVASMSRTDLAGARVDLTYRLLKHVSFGLSFGTVYLDVDGFELRAGWDLRPTAATAGSGWNNPLNLVPGEFGSVNDREHSGYTLSGCPFLGSCQTATRHVDVTGFDNRVDPHTPTDGALVKAGIVITGETTDKNFFTNGSFYDLAGAPDIGESSRITATLTNLRDTPGGSCTASWDRVPFWGQGLYLELLDAGVAGSCASVLTNAQQLIGANVRVEVYVKRDNWGANVDYGIRLDSVRISTVTSGQYTRPRAPMVMTIGAGPASAPSSFNVFGQMSMPRNDLNLRWEGPAPTDVDDEPVPIGGGHMILAGLGSYVGPDGDAGIVCCSPTKPAERILNLTAAVQSSDGSERIAARARVVVSDAAGPGAGLRIEDWSIE